MSNFEINIRLDAASLGRVAAMVGYQHTLEGYLTVAMHDSVMMMRDDAEDFMGKYFKNPTGQLASTLTYVVDSPYQAWMGTDSPYGRRRDRGFSGMTDSLGRYYPDDPGIFWAEAVAGVPPIGGGAAKKVEAIFRDALNRTALKMGGYI